MRRARLTSPRPGGRPAHPPAHCRWPGPEAHAYAMLGYRAQAGPRLRPDVAVGRAQRPGL